MITFPLTLGETGRGRNLVTLIGPPALRDGEVLAVVRTDRSYSRHRRSGSVGRHGPTRVIAEGRWAHGDAGNIASGPDMLLAVQPGACWFACGGDGVGHWFWVRPSGEVVHLSGTERNANPQAAIPLLRELCALPAMPADSQWRAKLAEYEAQFEAAAPVAPRIESHTEREERRAVAVGAVLGRMKDCGVVAHHRMDAARAMGEMAPIAAPALSASEEAILALFLGMEGERRRLVLATLAERGGC